VSIIPDAFVQYKRRFFPLYTFNVLGGIDATGAGVAFSYDAIGTLEKVPYSAAGVMPHLLTCSVVHDLYFLQVLDRASLNRCLIVRLLPSALFYYLLDALRSFWEILTLTVVQVAFKNQKIKPAGERSVQEALDLLKDTYASAGERDIMTGDSVEFMVRFSGGIACCLLFKFCFP
jgi:20S proteasome subunit beta 6